MGGRAMTKWLVAAAVFIMLAPLALKGEFKGTDDLAVQAIQQAQPGYEPWVHPLWQPPSAEVESLLFALQAAIGAGILGYVIGRRHGARKRDESS